MPNVIKKVGLGGINVKVERLRALRDDTVKSLMESMTANGLLQPIVLRPRGTMGYWLVAGRHRFEAARKLKWESIPANIFDGMDADDAELAEIDENLIRADLSPAEMAMHTVRRKELYEKVHGKAKAIGAAAANKKMGRTTAKTAVAFTTDTAKKTGKAARTVRLDAARGAAGRDWLKDIAGTSLDKGDEIDALIKLSDKARNALIKRAQKGEKVSAKTAAKQHARAAKEKELGAKIIALPTKKYGVMLEDYEWDHQTWSEKGKDRHAANHYPTSSNAHTAKEIFEHTKDRFKCAADDCVLFMWTTEPMLDVAIDVMRLRGFTYKTTVMWDKVVNGTGYWFTNRHEQMLVGVRGKVPAPAPGTQWSSIITERKGKHSVKPEKSYQMIEEYFPNTPKIELNARKARKGWDCWGFEAPVKEAAE